MANYSDTARALASQIDDDDVPTRNGRASTSPAWTRRSHDVAEQQPRWMQSAEKLQRRVLKFWFHFTALQRAGVLILGVVTLVLGVLALVYNERIFGWLRPAAHKWRELPAGWLLLWALTFVVSFPPLIGYSTCVTIAGFVFGMKGWFIMSTATVVGSTCSFLLSRTVLKSFVSGLTEKNQRFAALSLVLKHDGLKLLIMIRLCPLPYSLANGAISTIPTVTWQNFMLATAIASPKLLLHIFVGAQLGALVEDDKMSLGAKIVSYVSIAIGVLAGAATGYFIYTRTQARALELEAEEAAAAVESGGRRSGDADIDDDADEDEREARSILRRGADDISLHQTYEDDLAPANRAMMKLVHRGISSIFSHTPASAYRPSLSHEGHVWTPINDLMLPCFSSGELLPHVSPVRTPQRVHVASKPNPPRPPQPPVELHRTPLLRAGSACALDDLQIRAEKVYAAGESWSNLSVVYVDQHIRAEAVAGQTRVSRKGARRLRKICAGSPATNGWMKGVNFPATAVWEGWRLGAKAWMRSYAMITSPLGLGSRIARSGGRPSRGLQGQPCFQTHQVTAMLSHAWPRLRRGNDGRLQYWRGLQRYTPRCCDFHNRPPSPSSSPSSLSINHVQGCTATNWGNGCAGRSRVWLRNAKGARGLWQAVSRDHKYILRHRLNPACAVSWSAKVLPVDEKTIFDCRPLKMVEGDVTEGQTAAMEDRQMLVVASGLDRRRK
nr:golgi apparatus membrane protein tvp38 [Quercus suber]